ncbi:MAG: transposase [Sphingomonadales bacterium]|nr:transposase [Sphingomonadales bacterium]
MRLGAIDGSDHSVSALEWRRRWSDAERLQILAETFSLSACVAEVCRRHDVSIGLIYT